MSILARINRWKYRLLGTGFAALLIGLTVRTYRARAADAALVDAVKRGDQFRVTELLGRGAAPNVRELTEKPAGNFLSNMLMWAKPQKEGRGLLQIAFMDLNVDSVRNEILEKLILAGANPNGTDGKDHGYPLRAAASEESLNLMSFLLDHGARVNLQNEGGETALMYAARYGSLGSVRLLLARKADPNMRDHQDQSPLDKAVATLGYPEDRQCEIVRELLEHGADPNCKNARGESPLELAIKRGTPNDSQSGLLRTLLDHGADPNQRVSTSPDMTLIAWAGKMGRSDVVGLLREHDKRPAPAD